MSLLEKRITKTRLSKDQKLETIQTALDEGVPSLEEICEKTHLKPRGLRTFCKSNDIELPSSLMPYRCKPNMDKVIDRGGTQEEIGIAGGYPKKTAREIARQYLHNSGQYEDWTKKREEAKLAKKSEPEQRMQLHERLVYILKMWVIELAKKESWAHQKAFEYLMSYKLNRSTNYKPEMLLELFQNYEKAKKSGKNQSLRELGKPFMLHPTGVGRVFKVEGLKPMYGNLQRQSKQFYSKRRILIPKMISMGMKYSQIEYFLDISSTMIFYNKRKRDIKIKKVKRDFTQIGYYHLTYRLASQIYGAQAAGFEEYKDISELFDTSSEIVSYAITHKNEIAPKLVKLFRMAYDDAQYDKPYKKGLKV